MIEKIIHYVWIGDNDIPSTYLDYINSWAEYCPDYKLYKWSADNFDINCNAYVKQAYESKKYAFVSDYIRLFALYNYGGFYLDTDYELIKGLDSLTKLNCIFGFESEERVSTAFIGSEKHSPVIKDLLDYYNNISFINEDTSYNLKPNTIVITDYLLTRGMKLDNSLQSFSGITVFPSEYFSPKDNSSRNTTITNNTFGIHHFDASWMPEDLQYYIGKKEMLSRINILSSFVSLIKIISLLLTIIHFRNFDIMKRI